MKIIPLSVTLLLAPAFVGLAHAQVRDNAPPANAAEEETLELSPFKVSGKEDTGYFSRNTLAGTRTSERLVNIPQNIQIVNREVLEDLNHNIYTDTLQYAASGINARDRSFNDLYLRGFRVVNLNIMRDGIPGGTGYSNIGPTYDTERVEVVKGPAGLLYGQNSGTGGIINYVTKKPTSERQESISASVGSFNSYGAQVDASGPLEKSGFGYRATLEWRESDGFGRAYDYYEDRFASVTLEQKISPLTTLTFDYYHWFMDDTQAQLTVDTNGVLVNPSEEWGLNEPWVKHPTKYNFASLGLQLNLSPTFQAQLVANGVWGAYDWIRAQAVSVANATTGVLPLQFQAPSADNEFRNFVADVVKTFRTGPIEHKTTVGAFVSRQSSFNKNDFVNIGSINIYQPNLYNIPFPTFTSGVQVPGSPAPRRSLAKSNQESEYIQHQVTLFKGKLIAVGGYRHNDFNTTTITDLPTPGTASRVDKAAVYRAGVVLKPISALSVYYNYSESFVFNNGTIVGGPRDGQQLLPSYGINNEVGLKVETPNGRIFGSVAYYDLELTNVRTTYQLPNGQFGVAQDGAQTNRGAEVDLGFHFDLPAGPMQVLVTYYKGDLKNELGVLPVGVTNKMWSILAAQTIASGPLRGLKVGAGARHKGDVSWGSAAGQLRPFVDPAHVTTTAFLILDRDPYRFALNADNLGDKRFTEGGGTPTWLYLNPGRTFKFTTAYRF